MHIILLDFEQLKGFFIVILWGEMKDVKKGKPALKPLPKKVEEKRKIGLNNSAIRERLATTRPEHRSDIGSVWSEQKRLVKQRKNRELSKMSLVVYVLSKLKSIRKYIISVSAPKLKRLQNRRQHTSKAQQKKIMVATSVSVVLIIITSVGLFSKKTTTPSSLGARTLQGGAPDDGRTDEAPDFTPLKPLGREGAVQSVTRKTPSGEIIFTFKDVIDEIGIEVTQQKIPQNFKENQAESLKEMATA
ncbi:MAG TPA: hypothetical protein PKD20_05800, partial [Candidatus Saccharibacteria bacterium]|nr:hypothetical protein [Candidatus Saccharibacteria bacterium]